MKTGNVQLIMLCRNRVKDFTKWHDIFQKHAPLHQNAGLTLRSMWRKLEDENNVFFTFEVADKEEALKFIDSPSSVEAGKLSGVVDGEFHFLVKYI